MKDRSDDPSQHERTLLPRINISLLVDEQSFDEVRGFVSRDMPVGVGVVVVVVVVVVCVCVCVWGGGGVIGF